MAAKPVPRVAWEGFVLAGGRSERFGSDKALARLGGRTLLDRALAALEGCGLTPRVVARDPWAYRNRARVFVLSERPGRGPAEGLRAALAACAAPWALVLPVDMPGVDAPLLRCLVAAAPAPGSGVRPAEAPRAVCFAGPDGRRHPLPGAYHRSLAGEVEGLGEAPALQAVLDRAGVRVLGPEAVPGTDLAAALRNVNRPGDLDRRG